jgi:hypothetical protein
MRKSPSIVPGSEPAVYFVMDDLGKFGRVWREADVDATDYETVIRDLLSGQYSPSQVISFNIKEGWSRDVSSEVAEDLIQRCYLEKRELPTSLQAFVESHAKKKTA